MLHKQDLIDKTLQTHDTTVREVLWGYLSGVDREGSNQKITSLQAKAEAQLKKEHPTEDACILRLRAKYQRSYD